MHVEPMLLVGNVKKSAAFYTKLLGAENDHGRPDFDRIVAGGRVLFMLHEWGAEEHGCRAAIARGDFFAVRVLRAAPPGAHTHHPTRITLAVRRVRRLHSRGGV